MQNWESPKIRTFAIISSLFFSGHEWKISDQIYRRSLRFDPLYTFVTKAT